jgi:large conductance mechanosensitive channel
MKLASEFKAFLLKQNALALAVGVIIGAAVGKVVSGIVDDFIMPIVGVILPASEWRTAQLPLLGSNAIKYGDLIGRLVDFVIVAMVVFFIVRMFIKEEPKPPTKTCPFCLEAIPAAATRCRACTATL